MIQIASDLSDTTDDDSERDVDGTRGTCFNYVKARESLWNAEEGGKKGEDKYPGEG